MAKSTVTATTLEQLLLFLSTLGPGTTTLDLRRPGAAKRVQKFSRSANGDGPDELASKIQKAAEIDGQSRDVPIVYYELEASGPNSDQEPDAIFNLRVKGSGGGAGLDFDQPDIGQAFVHMVRANNELLRMLMASRDTSQEMLLRQLEYQGNQIQKHDERRVALFRLMEDMSEAKLRRELESNNAKLLEKRQELVAEKIGYYLPVAMNRLLGGGPGTGKTPMGEQLLNTLLEGMRPEQIEAITRGEPIALSEEQQLIFAELYVAAAAKARARAPKPIDVEPTDKGKNGAGQNGAAS